MLFSVVAAPTYIPARSVWGTFPPPHLSCTCHCPVVGSHSNLYVVASHSGLDLHFLEWLVTLSIFSNVCWLFVCLPWKRVSSGSLLIFQSDWCFVV